MPGTHTPGGFGRGALDMLDRCATRSLVVVSRHPHSVGGAGPQGKASLVPFLKRAAQLQREGAIRDLPAARIGPRGIGRGAILSRVPLVPC